MNRFRLPPTWVWLLGAALCFGSLRAQPPDSQGLGEPMLRGRETNVDIQAVETSTAGNLGAAGLGKTGWSVPAEISGPQSLVFRCRKPLGAVQAKLLLRFHTVVPAAQLPFFSVAVTDEPTPARQGRWQPAFPVWFTTAGGTLSRAGQKLQLTADAADATCQITLSLPLEKVTGFRIDCFPPAERGAATSGMTLRELRVINRAMTNSNIALGCAVRASHELREGMYPEFITDGRPETYAGPPAANLGADFYFEIDLRRVATLDHLSLRVRPDGIGAGRLSRVSLQLYDVPPGPGVQPVWSARHRADGSFPDSTNAEVIHGKDGVGTFRGRYLRISSDSPEPFSPELAEVEVYESLRPLGVTVSAQGKMLPFQKGRVDIPASAPWLSYSIHDPESIKDLPLGRHWRVVGVQGDWEAGRVDQPVEGRGLPPGKFEFQAAIRHSDLVWNEAILKVPFFVPTPFWQRPPARIAAALAAGLLAALLGWWVNRRVTAGRVAELERRNELSKERARIARDMHDVVGAQLTQLAVLHEIFAEEHPLPAETRGKLHQLTVKSRDAVVALDEVVWAVNPSNDTLANTASYLCSVAREYLTPLGIACREDVPDEWPDLSVLSHVRHQLLLAFNEGLQNVAKHARATQITLSLRFDGQTFRMRLEDDGVGLPDRWEGAEKDGINNMRARLASVGGKCRVQRRDQGGTVLEMHLPVCD